MMKFFGVSLGQYRKIVVFSLLTLVSACALNPITGIFGGGDDDEEEKENASDEDERISILALDEQLTVDPRYAGASVEIPPSYVNASWSQPGGEADHTLHHLSAPLDMKVVWKTDIGSASSRRARLTSPPIVVNDRVYVMDAAARVSSLDAETGERIWRTVLTPKIKEHFRFRDILRGPKPAQIGFGGGVAFDQGRIFVTSGFGFVAALDADTGEEIWRFKTSAAVRTPPTAYRGFVFFTTNTNEFVALNQETGKKEWTFQSFEETARFLSSSSPAAAGDLVVAPFSSGELVAFIADSGRAVWNETLMRQTRLTALSSLNDIAGSQLLIADWFLSSAMAGDLSPLIFAPVEPCGRPRSPVCKCHGLRGIIFSLLLLTASSPVFRARTAALFGSHNSNDIKKRKRRRKKAVSPGLAQCWPAITWCWSPAIRKLSKSRRLPARSFQQSKLAAALL